MALFISVRLLGLSVRVRVLVQPFGKAGIPLLWPPLWTGTLLLGNSPPNLALTLVLTQP